MIVSYLSASTQYISLRNIRSAVRYFARRSQFRRHVHTYRARTLRVYAHAHVRAYTILAGVVVPAGRNANGRFRMRQYEYMYRKRTFDRCSEHLSVCLWFCTPANEHARVLHASLHVGVCMPGWAARPLALLKRHRLLPSAARWP